MWDAQQDGLVTILYVMAAGVALFRRDLELFVAASGVLVALGVWRFGGAYRDRVEAELADLSASTGAGEDDSERIVTATQVLFRDAERSAGLMIIVGTLAAAFAPLAWRMLGWVH